MDMGYTRVNPFYLASIYGVTVLHRQLDKLLGAYINETNPGILINSSRPTGLMNMTCAHELGHFFLKHESTLDLKIEYGPHAALIEREADLFAYSLLTPSWLIPYVMNKKKWTIKDLTFPFFVYQLSLRLGLSYLATIHTIRRRRLISQTIANKLAAVAPKTIKESMLNGKEYNAYRDVWLIDENDQGLTLEPRTGDTLIVHLPSHSTSGFTWNIESISDLGIKLNPILEHYSKINPDQNTRIGKTGSMDFILDYEFSGERTARIELKEKRLFDPESPEIDDLEFSSEFHSLLPGLSFLTKKKILEE